MKTVSSTAVLCILSLLLFGQPQYSSILENGLQRRSDIDI